MPEYNDTIKYMFEKQIALLKNEIDDLKFEIVTRQKKPWHREAAALIAFAALLFSFGTTVVSYVRTAQHDVLNSRIELSSLIKEISNIPELHAKIMKTYQGSPRVIAGLSAQLNNRNLVLSKQAASVIDRIENCYFGGDTVLDVEYLAVATALGASLQYDKAEVYHELAFKRAADPSAAAGALRSKAGIAMAGGDADKMRKFMQKARQVFSIQKFQSTLQLTKDIVNANTEIQWGMAELELNKCDNAREHKIKTEHLVQDIPQGSTRTQFLWLLEDLSTGIEKCIANSSIHN
ncbi:MAG: hypothetical protein LWW97_10690 [Deltaproteobacteria bacterium]|nr:hypothetical protein [Deltaproteobacteria bacterium]